MIARIILFGAFLAASVAAHATEIVRVWPEWRTAASFVRLSELFGGPENPGNEIFLRTHADSRDGLYFLVRLAHAQAGEGTFVLSVVKPGKPDPVDFKFPATVPAGASVFQLGLTGPDWPDAKADPMAWRVAFVDSSGTEQVAAESFLWSPPK